MALGKNRIKYIRSLEMKKYRKAEGLFLAEGPKLVGELLGHLPCPLLAATAGWLERQGKPLPVEEAVEATEEELSRASLLKTPQQVLALFRQPEERVDVSAPSHALCLALDGVQDPGNLGTIVRLADWFGIRQVYCSPDTADLYNPKAVQATMGSIARVSVCYTPLPELLVALHEVPVYGTFLDAPSIYEQPFSAFGLIGMGNEGKGISEAVGRLVGRRLSIPNYATRPEKAESLNVAVATAIVCAEFRRRDASR